jgi:hypothetical protein
MKIIAMLWHRGRLIHNKYKNLTKIGSLQAMSLYSPQMASTFGKGGKYCKNWEISN